MKKEAKRKRRISPVRHSIGAVVLAALALVFAAFALGQIGNYEVVSESMAPTLRTGDRVLVDQRRHYVPKIGDVVVFEDPEQPGEMLTKRVAAVEGQSIRIESGYLYVDEELWAPLGQPRRVLQPNEYRIRRTPLAKGEIYVLGDNAGNSEDSLIYGPVKVESIRGNLWFVYWPPGRIGRVR